MKITMAHGSGGWETSQLIEGIFAKYFSNPILDQMEDSAVVPGGERLAFTTDSFVVNPVFFPGGDIGRLAVCGTVNDLLMSGSQPRYLSVGMILQEGLEIESLERIVRSMSETAKEADVLIVAGDTKVVEGNGELYINTSGIGHIPDQREVRASLCQPGDRILVSGYLGDHHAAIMSARMGIENEIRSDCAPLSQMVEQLFAAGISIRAMRISREEVSRQSWESMRMRVDMVWRLPKKPFRIGSDERILRYPGIRSSVYGKRRENAVGR